MNTAKYSQLPSESGHKISLTDAWPSELVEMRWSVLSFEKCEAAGLTYSDAFRKMSELEKKGVAGLCVVTDEAAERLES